MYYPSKRDLWMTIIVWLCALFFIVPPVFFPDFGVWMMPELLDKQWIKIILLFPFGFCLMWIWFKTGYSIKGNYLEIRYGPFNWKIKIDEIYSIRETRNPFTAPALYMDKIEISYANLNTIEISPKNKFEFISQLRKHNSNIKTDNQYKTIKEQ